MKKPPATSFRLDFPPELPISSRAEDIVQALVEHSVLILAGETGSGKTTQIPKMCLAAGRGTRGRIACTQPRRVAALSISRRVAEEMNVEWGREVGCKVRFSDQTSSATLIKFLTDGMLLAEVQGDPMLREYDTIIVDEAHERSLNIDFLLGHLRQLRYRRPELKIIITSATIDTKAFSEAFDGAPVIEVSGRSFPVETVYVPLDSFGSDYVEEERDPEVENEDLVSAKAEAWHYVDGAVETLCRLMDQGTKGDILVFMPSERDIRETCDSLEDRLGRDRNRVELVPLFGRLSNAEQQRVFAPSQRRKIIVATNIAETSLTIPGISTVIDTGLARLSRYSPQARTRRLPIEEVSQSSADQRKGRAGRMSDGLCLRLYAEADYLARPRFTQPEIQRANLADVILRLKAYGLGDIERFPFLNPPAGKAIRAGYVLLEELGAIVEREPDDLRAAASTAPTGAQARQCRGGAGLRPGSDLGADEVEGGDERRPYSASSTPGLWELTEVGRELARLPVDPTVGRMILQARRERCLREVLAIAAGLSIQDPRERPLEKQAEADAAHKRFAHPDSDFLTLLNIWESYHDEFENLSQGKLRRFCREHFLSYVRMREWRDIHTQLLEVLKEREDFRMSSVWDGRGEISTCRGGACHRPDSEMRVAGIEGGDKRRPTSERKSQDLGVAAPVRRAQGASGGAAAEQRLLFGSAAYRAVHRSILAGLLGNIATFDEESRLYKATNDRKVALFPGSVLHQKEDRKKRPQKPEQGRPEKGTASPRWIMASEIVETSRVYARTCAKLDPRWVLDLASHILKQSHSEPFWSVESGRVLVKQRTRLYGLELETRSVGYCRINPEHATEILIREGLVADTITWPFDFIAHNRKVREKIEFSLTRTRDSGYLNLDEALYRFYASRLMQSTPAIGSVAELVDFVKHRRTTEPRFLMLAPEDLRDPESLAHDAEAYPEALPMENRVIPLNYAYKPGQADDGVTLDLPVRDAASLDEAALDWAVPGHTREKIEHYLRSLPKELRRALVPFAETVPSVTKAVESLSRLRDGKMTLVELLSEHLRERFGIKFDPSVWKDKPLPEHLRVRVRVLDDEGREVCADRDLETVKTLLDQRQREAAVAAPKEEPLLWRKARARWEKAPSEAWNFGDIECVIEIGEQAGLSVPAYPALKAGKEGVSLCLMADEEEAERWTLQGLSRLIELQLSRDLGWLERDLRAFRQLGPLLTILAPLDQIQEDAFATLRTWLCDPGRVVFTGQGKERRLLAASFEKALEGAKKDLTGLVPKLVDCLREVFQLRQELMALPQAHPGLEQEVIALVPVDFLRTTPYGQWRHLARYLKAKKLRTERWKQNPAKDAERAQLMAPYARKATALGRAHPLYWLVEEYRVSVFAQELGTAETVSAVKLDRSFSALKQETGDRRPEAGSRPDAVGRTVPSPPGPVQAGGRKQEAESDVKEAPAPAPATAPKKATRLKSLDSLGNLLR